MSSDLHSVVISSKADGSWHALHVPSGKVANGLSKEEAEAEMRLLLGMDESGQFDEPLTSDRFGGIAKEIAQFLEGEVSDMLKMHSGYARLEAYEAGISQIRLGGGCTGCPSSTITLLNGVSTLLREQFGDEAIVEVIPVH